MFVWEILYVLFTSEGEPFFFSFLSFVLLGPHPQHMEVSRLGVQWELQLLANTTAMPEPSCICNLHQSSQRHQILNPLSEARDQICIIMDTNQICFHYAMRGTPASSLNSTRFSSVLANSHNDTGCRQELPPTFICLEGELF